MIKRNGNIFGIPCHINHLNRAAFLQLWLIYLLSRYFTLQPIVSKLGGNNSKGKCVLTNLRFVVFANFNHAGTAMLLIVLQFVTEKSFSIKSCFFSNGCKNELNL